ncbi:hypothetical protein ACFQY4_18200 [Catellatospora bangladeshensis]|uniref:Uncharacterized protein n=1 Tax=Catellatospora bangladeshensis TaxID=310355 RepID=A0A8J3JBY9_9ACTN|nr:hypothetical protein [Catellatospora bangladeshensis]GIF82052.1 hypothetical protein Cba03nite_34010 [Catellatospora bangladeshensis]
MAEPSDYKRCFSREHAQQQFDAMAVPVSIPGIRTTMAAMRMGSLLATTHGLHLPTWESVQVQVLAGVCDEAQMWTAICLLHQTRPSLWTDRLAPWAGPYDNPAQALTTFDERLAALPQPTTADRRTLARAWLTMTLALHQVQLTGWETTVVKHLAAKAPIPTIQTLVGWIIGIGQATDAAAAITPGRHGRHHAAARR